MRGGGKGPLVSKERSLTLAANTNDQVLFVPDKARSLTARNDGSPPTLSAMDSGNKPAVAVYGVGCENGIAGTLDASYYKGQGERQGTERTAVAVYENHAQDSRVKGPIKTAPSINAKAGTGGNNLPLVSYCVGNGQLDQARLSDKVGALNCMHDQQAVMVQKVVRRLTPTECERLQGLPDGYTLIDDKSCSDSARYKALGNGMAQPCADYVIRRIVEVMA